MLKFKIILFVVALTSASTQSAAQFVMENSTDMNNRALMEAQKLKDLQEGGVEGQSKWKRKNQAATIRNLDVQQRRSSDGDKYDEALRTYDVESEKVLERNASETRRQFEVFKRQEEQRAAKAASAEKRRLEAVAAARRSASDRNRTFNRNSELWGNILSGLGLPTSSSAGYDSSCSGPNRNVNNFCDRPGVNTSTRRPTLPTKLYPSTGSKCTGRRGCAVR